ncbi:MAG: hypothetical protein Ta2B_25780 [Termitinemataceae bacterium]|nr:MAG: hypothetical protein Ta2B_25780 [Termitinemataceae bacterium]
MATVKYDIDNLPPVTEKEWERIDAIKDEDIDFSDIPEIMDISGFTRWDSLRAFETREN